jgi:methyl-accepting chemotaxis protein
MKANHSGFMFRWRGVAPRLLTGTMFVVVGVVLVMAMRASARLSYSLTEAYESKGEAIALALAAAAEQGDGADISLVQGSVDANKVIDGVRYIFLTDASNVPVVHTFSPTFPSGLELRNTIALGEKLNRRRVKVAHDVPVGDGNGGGRVIDIAAPIGGGALGSVHVGMDQRKIDSAAAETRWEILTWGGGVAIAGFLVSLLLTVAVVIRPIQRLTYVTGEIVAKGDLTQKIDIRSRDEIGELAATFSQMVERLRDIPKEIADSTNLLEQSVSQLRASALAQGDTLTTQASALNETHATAQQIKESSLLAAQRTETALRHADRAESVSRTGEQAVERSLDALKDIRQRVVEIAGKISGLGTRAVQVGRVADTVKDLADQSNMLALNAAIEAARSGEHGRGFAVVAREMRSLADQSVSATKQVREILDDITSAIRTAVSITERGAQDIDSGLAQVRRSGETLTELSGIVKENSGAMREIDAAVGQQNAGIGQIFRAVTAQNTMMGEAVKRLQTTDAAIQTLSDVADRLVLVVRRFHV